MRSFEHSTFIFLSTNAEHAPDGVEQRWLALMSELVQRGSTVHFICFAESPLAEAARSLGVTVAPYILDKWNVVRSASRLRKYLRRYDPVCAHSTGVEGDLLLRWAARRVPTLCIAVTLDADPQRTRRRRPVDALMFRFDEAGLSREDAVFVTREDLIAEVLASGVPPERVILDPDPASGHAADGGTSVERHLEIYRIFMASRGQGA